MHENYHTKAYPPIIWHYTTDNASQIFQFPKLSSWCIARTMLVLVGYTVPFTTFSNHNKPSVTVVFHKQPCPVHSFITGTGCHGSILVMPRALHRSREIQGLLAVQSPRHAQHHPTPTQRSCRFLSFKLCGHCTSLLTDTSNATPRIIGMRWPYFKWSSTYT